MMPIIFSPPPLKSKMNHSKPLDIVRIIALICKNHLVYLNGADPIARPDC